MSECIRSAIKGRHKVILHFATSLPGASGRAGVRRDMKKCRKAGERELDEAKKEAQEEADRRSVCQSESREVGEPRSCFRSHRSLVDGQPSLAMRKPRKPRWPLSGRDIAGQPRADGCGLECNSPLRRWTIYLPSRFCGLHCSEVVSSSYPIA